jgi:hypothetical protein
MGKFVQCVGHGDLAASDLGRTLSQSLGALAELERKAQETESAQARTDQASLLSTADEYAPLVNSVRVSHPCFSDICTPNTGFGCSVLFLPVTCLAHVTLRSHVFLY